MRKVRHVFAVFSIVFAFLLPRASSASSNLDFLLSDTDLTDTFAMNQDTLQRFLLERGTLGKIQLTDTDGVPKSPAEIITRIAHEFKLSPKFLLVLLQREQSLVEDPTPNEDQFDWATGYGVCDSCDKRDPRLASYIGFANQLQEAARLIRTVYLPSLAATGMTPTGFGPGIIRFVDGSPVTPRNDATAILLTYTPHSHGNENFAQIWSRWFMSRYPDGSLLQARGNQDVWLIQYGRRRPFVTKAALTSRYDLKNLLPVTTADLSSYEIGPPISFPNYSLLLDPASNVYLLADDELRPVDAKTFREIGFSPDELIEVTADDIGTYTMGARLTSNNASPFDELIRDSDTGRIYDVVNGAKHYIPSEEILRDRFPEVRWTNKSNAELRTIPDGDAVKFRNGTLVKARGNASVYLVSNGVRRPIPNAAVFHSYGFEFKDIIETTPDGVAVQQLGNPIEPIHDPLALGE